MLTVTLILIVMMILMKLFIKPRRIMFGLIVLSIVSLYFITYQSWNLTNGKLYPIPHSNRKWVISTKIVEGFPDDWSSRTFSSSVNENGILTETEACLLAIRYGAKFILHLNDEMFNIENLQDFTYSDWSTGLQYAPSHHGNTSNGYFFCIGKKHKVVIQKCIRTSAEFNRLPNFFLSNGSLFMDDYQNALFSYDVFWLLGVFSICGVTDDTSPMIRNLIIQRIVSEINGDLLIIPGCELNSYTSEGLLKAVPNEMYNAFKDWKCQETFNIQTCFIDLVKHLQTLELLEKDSLSKVNYWLTQLSFVNYVMPRRQEGVTSCSSQFPVLYNFRASPDIKPETIKSSHYHNVCPHIHSPWKQPIIDDIALIVTYNEPKFYHNINFTQLIHRPYFKHLIICGPNITTFYRTINFMDIPSVTFLKGYKDVANSWTLMYKCTMLAIEIHLGVKGYLQIGDDVLLNSWNVLNLPRDRFWIINNYETVNRLSNKAKWAWWKSYRYRTNTLLNKIKTSAGNENLHNEKTFWKNFIDATGSEDKALVKSTDFYYIPSKYSSQFLYYADLFYEANIMNELAVGTIILGLVSKSDVKWINGSTLWGGNRNHSYKFFNPQHTFIHPVKHSKLLYYKEYTSFLCDIYLQYMTNVTSM
ncbi:uncharacterized protein LOC126830245 isoform X2 [Patella vulgata]|nr:uncharacterized protein LOC126830245 isoform X2 [Patella vulgata]